MSSYFEDISLGGFAHWMRCQAREETDHAMRLYYHLIERGGRVKLDPIKAVSTEWKSPLDVFQETYTHETKVTKMINDLLELAMKEKDHATVNMLQWFVDEQVEEEDSADEIVQKLKLVGKQGNGLFMIDRELAQRAYTPSPDLPVPTGSKAA
jgi:ferritin